MVTRWPSSQARTSQIPSRRFESGPGLHQSGVPIFDNLNLPKSRTNDIFGLRVNFYRLIDFFSGRLIGNRFYAHFRFSVHAFSPFVSSAYSIYFSVQEKIRSA